MKKIILLTISIMLITLSILSCSSTPVEDPNKAKQTVVFDPYAVANSRYVINYCTGTIDFGKDTTDVRISDCKWDTKMNILDVQVENFKLYMRADYDLDRKFWNIKEETIDNNGNTIPRGSYVSDIDFDKDGFLREYNFTLKKPSEGLGTKTKIRIQFKREERN